MVSFRQHLAEKIFISTFVFFTFLFRSQVDYIDIICDSNSHKTFKENLERVKCNIFHVIKDCTKHL